MISRSPSEIDKLRRSNELVADVFRAACEMVAPGVTTLEIDQFVFTEIKRRGARPAFLGYHGYPSSVCASVNEVVVHGIPSARKLRDGDILSLDIGVEFDGYFGDCALTIPVGEVSDEARRLMSACDGALHAGIEQACAGNRLGDISHAVQTYAETRGYGVVRDFVGHGIGTRMHEEPQVPNFGKPGTGPRLRPGLCLAIEPMLNVGGPEVEVLEDKWTVVTRDRSLSAHFEHTVVITENGPEILTIGNRPPGLERN